jgi:probable rRNA maturation factor
MMFKLEISASIKRNLDLPVDKKWLEGVARRVLEVEGISSPAEMGLLITDSRTIRKLNRIYRGVDAPTDVLAFQMTAAIGGEPAGQFVNAPDGIKHLGEVIISYPQAVRQARDLGQGVTHELALLIVHGVLHLLGYDHELPAEKQSMKDKENEILALLALV